MPLSNAGKEVMLNAFGAQAVYFSLHSTDPGTSGTGEIVGGSPAYARQLGAWAAASADQMSMAGAETFDIPGGGTSVGWFGAWDAVSGGTFLGGGALSATEVFNSQGTYTLTNATITIT